MKKFLFAIFFLPACLTAQDTVRYTGNTLVNVDYHHGALRPAVGVHNIQVFRANREQGDNVGTSWTYNHAPMLAYWKGKFYLEFLSNPVGEHRPPGQTFLVTSPDGYAWTKPVVVFPPYKIPDGTTKEGRTEVAKNLFAVNHQRMGFYVSKSNRLLVLAFYGVVLGPGDDPNDGHGIGRVVREAYADGTFGPIYFLRYNTGWTEKNTSYPAYGSSRDKGFVEACNEILKTPIILQQWVEEADKNDPLIPLKKDLKALSAYHLKDGRIVGLWKNALTSISKDEGKTWLYSPLRAPHFVNSNAKIWGQATSDGKFATVYNPSEFRWPLALSTSENGIDYTNLLLVNGEITSMRYGGAYKSYGPQYVRGISEGDGTPSGGNMWVTYSVNKEDIWVSSIPVPVTDKVTKPVDENFSSMPDGSELKYWNIYSGLWASAKIEKEAGSKNLVLRDSDPFDFAKAERIIPAGKKVVAEFTIIPKQADFGMLSIEFQDGHGIPGVRLTFDSTGNLQAKAGYRDRALMKFSPNEKYVFQVELNADNRFYTATVNGKALPLGLFFAPLHEIERVVFRTGKIRRFPDADTPTDQMYDLPNGGSRDKEAAWIISNFKTK